MEAKFLLVTAAMSRPMPTMADDGDGQDDDRGAQGPQLDPLRAEHPLLGDGVDLDGAGGDGTGGGRGRGRAGGGRWSVMLHSVRVARPLSPLGAVVFDGVGGHLHEGLLEGGLLGGQLVDGEAVVAGQRRRCWLGVRPVTRRAPSAAGTTVTSGPASSSASAAGFGRADPHRAGRGAPQELLDADIGDEPAPTDHDDVLGGDRHLVHQVAGHEDGAALGGQALEQVADPADALGVEAVDRLVEDRASPDRPRRATAMPSRWPMPEREAADALGGNIAQADQADDVVHPPVGDAVGGGQGQQVVAGGPTGVDGPGLEQGADLVQRRGMLGVVLAVDRDLPGGRGVEAEDHAHGRRLAGPVGAQEAGDHAGVDGEAEIADGGLLAVDLGEVLGDDHRAPSGTAQMGGRVMHRRYRYPGRRSTTWGMILGVSPYDC